MRFDVRLRRLLSNSLITGVPQIVTTKNYSRRLLKTAVFGGCVFGFLYQTFNFLLVYWAYPTVVDVQSTFPDNFPLPAFSVCSANGIKSTLFCAQFPHLCTTHKNLTEFCKNKELYCDINTEPGDDTFPTVLPNRLPPISREEYRDMGLKPEDVIIGCKVFNIPDIFYCNDSIEMVNVLDSMGLPNNCFTLNGDKAQRARKKSQRIIKAKANMVLTLRAEKTTIDQFYTGTPFAIQLSVQNPKAKVNPFREGFSIKPCANYYVTVSKRNKFLLPPPYTTNCTDYRKLYDQRGGDGPLTQRACREECLLNLSIATFGCINPFVIYYPNMAKLCQNASSDGTLFEKCVDPCPPPCEGEDFRVDIQEQKQLEINVTQKKSNFCISLVTFAFHKMEITTYRYLPKYESIELFGYIGGYMGMWLGVSLMALNDVLELLILLFQLGVYRFRKQPAGRSKGNRRNKVHYVYQNPNFYL